MTDRRSVAGPPRGAGWGPPGLDALKPPSVLEGPPGLAGQLSMDLFAFGLRYPDPRVRAMAIVALWGHPSVDRVKAAITPLLQDTTLLVRDLAEYTLGRAGVCHVTEERQRELLGAIAKGLNDALTSPGPTVPFAGRHHPTRLELPPEHFRILWTSAARELVDPSRLEHSSREAASVRKAEELLRELMEKMEFPGTEQWQLSGKILDLFGGKVSVDTLVLVLGCNEEGASEAARKVLIQRSADERAAAAPSLVEILRSPFSLRHHTACDLLVGLAEIGKAADGINALISKLPVIDGQGRTYAQRALSVLRRRCPKG